MMRRRLLPLCAFALATAVIASGGAGATGERPPIQGQPGPHGFIDDESVMRDVDCDTAQLAGPAATSEAHLIGAPKLNLDVLVMVDSAQGAAIAAIRNPKSRAAAQRRLFEATRKSLAVSVQSYEPLDIALRYDDFLLLQPLVEGKPRERTDNAEEIIALAKEQLGGERRKDVDVVYVVTDVDIQVPGIGKGVAGLADCIGGVALADRAFAVGETGVIVKDSGIPIGPVTFYKDLTAKIAAHEIGHLMGGHHHYQECGTPAVTAAGRGEPGPCSIMSNFVDFQTIPFSTVNGIVVRGHAEEWASRNDR